MYRLAMRKVLFVVTNTRRYLDVTKRQTSVTATPEYTIRQPNLKNIMQDPAVYKTVYPRLMDIQRQFWALRKKWW